MIWLVFWRSKSGRIRQFLIFDMIKTIKVGSRLVEKGKIYRVYKIEKTQRNGESDRIIHYKPFFSGTVNADIICCVPETSLEEINVRYPLPKEDIDRILAKLSIKVNKIGDLDVIASKEALRENNLEITAEIVHRFWVASKRVEENFTKSNRDLLEHAMLHFIEEVALVYNITLETARAKTLAALET